MLGFRQFAQSVSGLLIRDFKRKSMLVEKKFDKLLVDSLNENSKFYLEISIEHKNSLVRFFQEQQIPIDNDIYIYKYH